MRGGGESESERDVAVNVKRKTMRRSQEGLKVKVIKSTSQFK